MTGCQSIQRALWAGETVTDPHLATCAECATEARRSAQLGAALASMRAEVLDVPPHLEAALVASIPVSVAGRVRGLVRRPVVIRSAALGAAAASAAAFGVIVARRMARPGLAG
jgi:anti-sigma factor RsiW